MRNNRMKWSVFRKTFFQIKKEKVFQSRFCQLSRQNDCFCIYRELFIRIDYISIDMVKKPRITKNPPQKPSLFGKQKSNRCPRCFMKFKSKQIKVLFKDFLECQACGNMWVCNDIDQVYRYL